MAKNINLESIVYNGEFFGTFEKLRRIISKAGQWEEKAIAKVFVGDDGDHIIWWPDTGDVLHVYHAEPWNGFRNHAAWAERRERGGCRGAGRWNVFAHKNLGKVSLPELVFRDPWFLLDKLLHRVDIPEEIDKAELAEITDKISAIRIPGSVSTKGLVIHKFTAVDYFYEGFTATSVPIENTRQRGCAVVDHRISLCWAATGYERAGWEQTPIVSLLRVLEPDTATVWDREKCEAFFDEDSNFLSAPRKRAMHPRRK